MQKCRRCPNQLIDLQYTKDKGLLTLCNECRERYKAEQSENKKKYYKEVIIERRNKNRPPRKDRAKMKEEKRLRRNMKRQSNIEQVREYHRDWRKRNKEKSAEYQKKYIASKENIRFASRLRTLVYVALKAQWASKYSSTVNLIGCSIEQLQSHLASKFQPGMSWANHGHNGWHIDHIIPCSLFDLTDCEQQKKCFHYTNLQPLWAIDNLKKSNKITAA
jgi:hypothetical protein